MVLSVLGGAVWLEVFSVNATLAPYLTLIAVSIALMMALHTKATVWAGASRLTWIRAQITVWLLALLWVPEVFQSHGLTLGLLGLTALLIDGFDGWWARRFDQTTALGARFDMETDAALIMVLSLAVWLSGKAEMWVLWIGLMRYVFIGAQFIWPWLEGSLPPSLRRRVICVVQVSVLLLVLPNWFPPLQASLILTTGLALLVYSFAVDTLWLWRHRHHTKEIM